MERSSSRLGLVLSLCAPLVVGLTPTQADACGGTFCDAGPQTMPVDQTGESIVFWIDHGGDQPHTEAHVQIEYEGDAERFAWIIPVTSVPEISVGSQALFDNLLSASVPTFTIQSTTIGDCSGGFSLCTSDLDSGGPNRGAFAADGAGLEGTGGGGSSEQSESLPGPDILDRGFAGAFEYVTLTGDNVQEVVDWLEEAGYAQDPEAPPILAEYLAEGFVFVAVKLRSGQGVDAIHPLTIRYAGTEPCIPIRLTRIAAVDDMAIRAFFLGEGRVASQNWPQVIFDHARIDWANGAAASYTGLVSEAIDEAGGRAFITEYAGTDAVVSTNNVFADSWDAAAFVDLPAVAVVDELIAQGLINWNLTACETCVFRHPLVPALLETYLPPPDGLDPIEFWSCLSCNEDAIDPGAWDGLAFADEFSEHIVTPGQHAIEMLGSATYLTRLFTLISPHEMIEDPLFHETELGDVSAQIVATRVSDCDGGPTYVELADGRQIALDDGGAMPDIPGLPAAERIERVPSVGPAQVEVDNHDLIHDLLDDYNAGRVTGPQPDCSVANPRIEAVLAMFAIFGIAGLSRRPRC